MAVKNPGRSLIRGSATRLVVPWQMEHRSADDYGKFALEAAKLMKLTDPNIKLIAAGSSTYGADSDWTGWTRTILQYLRRHADYLSLHLYVGNQQNNFG